VSDGLTVLIIGGYGTFGGRIVELLQDEPRLTLWIAGRSLERARVFCDAHRSSKACLVPVAFDRGGDVDAQLLTIHPCIVVDASGPFQSYGHQVIEACIALKVHYFDLADDPKFVAGIAEFDDAARASEVSVLSGVSSFPMLTAAVARHLSTGMARVDTIRGGIAPSPYAEVGGNVIRAIAGYAGLPVMLRRNKAQEIGHPFAEQMRYTIAPSGYLPLRRRLFSLVDVPDLRVMADLWPEVRTVWMGAAPVPAILHRALIMLAWLVRFGLVPSLSRLAPLMYFATNHLRWGEHRGGMFVEVEGENASGERRRRSWHMIAEGNDGPYIPSMAVEALIRKWLAGKAPQVGARAATRDLELEDYHAVFAGRAIVTDVRDYFPGQKSRLYPGLLGTAWQRLPAEIRAIHDGFDHASGRATVERGRSLLARLIVTLLGLPEASGDTPVSVRFAPVNGAETWTRTFGRKRFTTHQFAGTGKSEYLLCERVGLLTFAMALVAQNDRLTLVLRRWRCLGIALPGWLLPRAVAYEAVECGKFHFHVEIGHRLVGLIVRYRGWLEPDQTGGCRG
jgi:Domain of unknown function (DUF4166)/Saccharopine dehydrogenase NADP binding domain